jgi:hypothetical protein
VIWARNAGASTEFRLLRFLEGTHQVHDNGRAPQGALTPRCEIHICECSTMSFSNHPPLLPPARLLSASRHGPVRLTSAVRPGQCHEASPPPRHRLGDGLLPGPSPSPSWEELLGRR